jgi:hypothetical protein
MSTSKEVVEEKIPWHFLIPFMIVLGVFTVAINPLNAFGTWQNPPGWSATMGTVIICYSALTALPFISFWFVNLLGRFSFFKKRISPITLTWLYTTTLCLSFYLGYPHSTNPCTNYGVFIGNRILSPPEETVRLIPWFMAPPVDVARQSLYGGVPTPWADIMPMIIFWWIFSAVYGILMVSIATLFRKHWIDVEKVPFPHALAAHELLVRTLPERRVKFSGPFLIGIILGVVTLIPTMLIGLFPWFPDIYGWRTGNCGFGSHFVQPGEPLASIVAMGRIGKEPLGVAIAYFAPLHILFNMWFWWLVIVILAQIAYTMGYYTGILDLAGCGRIWCGDISITYGEPFKWTAVMVGGMWSLAIFLVILSRRYIVDTIRAAFGKMDSSSRAEFEKSEPMSYRSTYMFLICSFIAALAILLISGISPESAILTVINMIVLWFASMRLLGLAGIYWRKTDKGYALHRLLLWPRAPEVMDRNYVLSAWFNTFMTDAPDQGEVMGGNFLVAFLAYRMAALTGVSSRSVFKILIVSIVIYALITPLVWIPMVYTYGSTRLQGTWGMVGCNALLQRSAAPETWNSCPGTEPWIPHFTVGFILVGLLSLLHARYVWFPFEPVGFILSIACFEWGFWSYAVIAWILKMMTLRVGGSRLYEEFGAPLAGGYIAGYMLTLIPGIILYRIRFFTPF